MKFSHYIARRYLFSKSSNNAINIITGIAALGVFAGAFSLFIVLSGFTGLKDFSLSFSNKYDPDLKVLPVEGKSFFVSPDEQSRLNEIPGLQAFSQVIEERVFLEFKEKHKTAYIKGVDQQYQRVTQIDSAINYGAWFHPLESQVVIGNGISRDLTLGTFDYAEPLRIMVPKPGTGQVSSPSEAFNTEISIVSGIYSINEELDEKFVYSSMNFARNLLNLESNEVTALELKLEEGAQINRVSEAVQAAIETPVEIKTRAQLNDALYKMLNTENLAVYLIFTLVLTIALFNVVGSIIMVILDKQDNIKTLYSLGATPVEIRNIFFLQGVFLTLLGGAIGLAVSILVVYLQLQYSLVMITPTLPYPVAITWQNMLVVMLTISVLGTISSYIAASRSKKALE